MDKKDEIILQQLEVIRTMTCLLYTSDAADEL